MTGDCVFEENKDLTSYNTMGLRVHGDLLTIGSESALRDVLGELNRRGRSYRVIGRGSNLILPERSDDVYICLDIPFDKTYLSRARDEYEVPANVPLYLLSSHAVRFGVKGWEVFTGIPATVGGAVCTNAGTRLGEFCEIVRSICVMNRAGRITNIDIDKDSYSYRKNHVLSDGDIVLGARLVNFGQDSAVGGTIRRYLEYRSKSQPLSAKTSGCIFKNIASGSSGELLDRAGFKGLQFKGMKISEKHANFMVNEGGATAKDVEAFIELVREKIMLQYGVELDVEVEF